MERAEMQGLSRARVSVLRSHGFPVLLVIPTGRYVTFCNEKNIARVFEPDRGDITKCARRFSRLVYVVTFYRRYLMGVENFQQIKQVNTFQSPPPTL